MFTQNIHISLYMDIDIFILQLHVLQFAAVGDLLNSTEYSEQLHFSIEVPI